MFNEKRTGHLDVIPLGGWLTGDSVCYVKVVVNSNGHLRRTFIMAAESLEKSARMNGRRSRR